MFLGWLLVLGCSGASSDKPDHQVKAVEPSSGQAAPAGTEQQNPEDAGVDGKFQKQENSEGH